MWAQGKEHRRTLTTRKQTRKLVLMVYARHRIDLSVGLALTYNKHILMSVPGRNKNKVNLTEKNLLCTQAQWYDRAHYRISVCGKAGNEIVIIVIIPKPTCKAVETHTLTQKALANNETNLRYLLLLIRRIFFCKSNGPLLNQPAPLPP